MKTFRTLTEPTIEPVTLEEARSWCRLADDDTAQDWSLLRLIVAARRRAETITGRAFARRTIEVRLDKFPDDDGAIELPMPPLVSVDYLVYATSDGDVAMDAGSPGDVLVDTASMPGRITPLYGASWPSEQEQIGAVRIGATCGYATINDVPDDVKLWMQQRVSTWFNNREHVGLGAMREMSRDFVDGLLDDYRVRWNFG